MTRGVSLELAVFAAVALVAAAAAPGHAGWLYDADGLTAAGTLSPVAGHGPAAILAGALAALIPVGELAFRVALVGGLALAATCAGIVALVRALTPAAAGAGALVASVVAIAPAAAGSLPTAGAAMTSALVVWTLVAVVRARRSAARRAPSTTDGPTAATAAARRAPSTTDGPTAVAAATAALGPSEAPFASAAGAAAALGALGALDPLAALILALVVALSPLTLSGALAVPHSPLTPNGARPRSPLTPNDPRPHSPLTLSGARASASAESKGQPRPSRRRLPILLAIAATTAALLLVPLALRGGAGALADAGPGGLRALLSPWGPDPAGIGVALAHLGDGAGAVLVLAGLLGLGLGATTGLPGAASCLVAALGLALTAGLRPDGAALPSLAVLAAGAGPLAAAVSRLGPRERAPLIATIAALPIAVVAAVAPRHLAGPERTDAGARVAADVLGAAPSGPGVFIATLPALHGAARVEQQLGGLRPDLALARRDRLTPRALAAIDRAQSSLHTPRIDDAMAGGEDERLAVVNLRRGLTAASDGPGFGRLDPRLATPAGRGFALALTDDTATAAPPPPRYPGPVGERVAAFLAVERARHEAMRGRLEAAARAAGQGERFGAADLAILDGAVLDRARPALFAFVPGHRAGELPPRWLPDLLGDDLAWVAGLAAPDLAADAPAARRLHARWRAVLSGGLAPDDPSLRALGVPAARATARMLADLGRADLAERAARALVADVEDGPTLLVLGSVLAERGGVGSSRALTDADRPILEEASTFLARATAADRRSVDAWIIHGLVLHRLGRADEARAAWLGADALAPGRADIAELLRGVSSPAP